MSKGLFENTTRKTSRALVAIGICVLAVVAVTGQPRRPAAPARPAEVTIPLSGHLLMLSPEWAGMYPDEPIAAVREIYTIKVLLTTVQRQQAQIRALEVRVQVLEALSRPVAPVAVTDPNAEE